MITLTFILITVAGWCLLNVAYKKTNHYQRQFGQVGKYRRVPAGLELANLGSNHARYGFDYKGLGLNVFNFALSPQYLLYDLQILKAYVDCFAEWGIVLIVLPGPVFSTDGLGRLDEKYYLCLPSSLIPNYSWLKKLKTAVFPLLSNLKAVRYLIKDVNVPPPAKNSRTHCKQQAIKRRDGWMRQFGLRDMVSGELPDEVIREFDKTTLIVSEIIAFCKQRALRPVIVIPPVSRELIELLGPAYLQKALYDNIEKANVYGVPVLDYLGDEQFMDYSLYTNSDFLTRAGAKIFTKQVVKDLRRLRYL